MKMTKAEFLVFILTSLVCNSLQGDVVKPNFNANTDGVVELTQKNFRTLVLNSDDQWLVDFEFSGPDCSYCIKLSEIIKKAVSLLKEKNIKVGYVDYLTVEGKKLADAYKLTMFPVVYLFGKDKEYPTVYPFSPGSVEEFVSTVVFLLKKPPAAEGRCGQDTVQNENSDTYELTDDNFEEVVLKCEDPWIINFYVPEVKLCADFIPYFEAAAKEFKGRAKFGSFYQLDSRVAEKYNAYKVCTVKLFPAGSKDHQPVDFNNGSHSMTISTNLIPWIKTALAGSLPIPEVTELTSQSVLESKCKNSGVTSCIFLFLAKSDKCNADCKGAYIDLLNKASEAMKAEHWAWFWTTQERQPDFERTFGINIFPGALAIDLSSNSYSVLRGTATESKLLEFIKFYASGRLPSKNMPTNGFPSVKS